MREDGPMASTPQHDPLCPMARRPWVRRDCKCVLIGYVVEREAAAAASARAAAVDSVAAVVAAYADSAEVEPSTGEHLAVAADLAKRAARSAGGSA